MKINIVFSESWIDASPVEIQSILDETINDFLDINKNTFKESENI